MQLNGYLGNQHQNNLDVDVLSFFLSLFIVVPEIGP